MSSTASAPGGAPSDTAHVSVQRKLHDPSDNDPYELVWAATRGDGDEVRRILEKFPDRVDNPDEEGSTPLIAAAWTNKIDVVKTLLAKGANIHSANRTYQWTALHAAAAKGHFEMVELLLEHKADPLKFDSKKNMPYDWAHFYGHAKVCTILAAAEKASKDEKDGADAGGDAVAAAPSERVCAAPECIVM